MLKLHLANVSVQSVHLQVADALRRRRAVEIGTVLPRRPTAHVGNCNVNEAIVINYSKRISSQTLPRFY